MESLSGEDGFRDQFPVGMRVLAVDDDLACLRILEQLLLKCQYQVTTTNEAAKALTILRESQKSFDLVITDVDMPGMDGFKLLELVGLEMDLPVIMLSAYGNIEFVMKGIKHGACDYLLKPVRLEELRIIWQHVIRKQKSNAKDDVTNAETQEEARAGISESSNAEQNSKNKKRKDHSKDGNEEEGEDEDSEQDNEDSSAKKKSRVVWSPELHHKFVAAVTQLGYEKAVPKKILDLMNVEGLTRENVASHLQKFRLFLKKLSDEAKQTTKMGTGGFASKDASYYHMDHLDGFRDFHSLASTRQLPSTALSSYPQAGMLGRANSSTRPLPNFPGIGPSSFIQKGHCQNLTGSVSPFRNYQSNKSAAGNCSSLDQNPLLGTKSSAHIGDLNRIRDRAALTFGSGLPDSRIAIGGSSSSLSCGSSNPLMLPSNHQQTHHRVPLGNQSSLHAASLNADSLVHTSICGSSGMLGQSSAKMSRFLASPLSMNQSLGHDQVPANNLRYKVGNSAFFQNLGSEGVLGDFVQNNSFMNKDYLVSAEKFLIDNSSVLHGEAEKAATMEPKISSGSNIPLDQSKSDNVLIHNSHDTLDDIMSEIMKQDDNGIMSMTADFGFDSFPPGSCL